MAAEQKIHRYQVKISWTGNNGHGTANYRAYERSHEITVEGKPSIPGSSDVNFRGDQTKYNPEELLVASLAACHMLWYLHLCAETSIVVTEYLDQSVGTMWETEDGRGRFAEVVLKPVVTVTSSSDSTKAEQLHEKAHSLCFIANSVNFPVRCEPSIQIEHAA
ncbi:OsmC family protein [Nostocales cyanobacterium LEGE 11386]|nr:OsmC family protein [Nostocales cyanobacterium LEGE 11386]